MRKKVIVRAPVLTRSGYGEHGRFVLRALREREDLFDVYIVPISWGQTGWLAEDTEERRWIDQKIKETAIYANQGGQFDVSLQVTIPNEWISMAPVNIGITAGIETTKVSPVWIEKANFMDKIITISEHSKNTFADTVYHGNNKETGQPMTLKLERPIDIMHYPVKTYDSLPDISLDLEPDFNYLLVAQAGPRKNVENTIRWFVEENFDQNVGLVVKLQIKSGCVLDRLHSNQMLEGLLKKYPASERKCKVYLLHGDMSDAEIHSLYVHPKIKCLVSATHGEGFGLPLFEAAYSAMPVIAPGWSGQCDFLYAPFQGSTKKKKKKSGRHPYFAEVEFDIVPVHPSAVWDGVLEKDSMWCEPKEGSFKMRLRQVRKNYDKWKKKASALQGWILKNFEEKEMYKRFLDSAFGKLPQVISLDRLPKISIITSVYDGDEFIRPFLEDITSQTIFEEKCELILINANSPGNEEAVINEYIKKYPNNIVYKKLEEDPGIYGVWNMAVKMATGEYLTNANLDDRKTPTSLEMHAKELFANKDVDLVYADMFLTEKPNEVFERNSSEGRRYNFADFSYDNLKMSNLPHAAPMWRKSYHEKYGYFDDKYRSAGDWEMWLRGASQGSKFKKIHNILGLYYFNPKGISTNPENFSWKDKEEKEIFMKYSKIAPDIATHDEPPAAVIL